MPSKDLGIGEGHDPGCQPAERPVPCDYQCLSWQLDQGRQSSHQLAVPIGLVEPPARTFSAHAKNEELAFREVVKLFADQPRRAAIRMGGKAPAEELDLIRGEPVSNERVGGQDSSPLTLSGRAFLLVPIKPRPNLAKLLRLAGRLEVLLEDLAGRSRPHLIALVDHLLEQVSPLGVANIQKVMAEHYSGAGVVGITRQHVAEQRFGCGGAFDLRPIPGRLPERRDVLDGPGRFRRLQQLPAFRLGDRLSVAGAPAAECAALPVTRQIALDRGLVFPLAGSRPPKAGLRLESLPFARRCP